MRKVTGSNEAKKIHALFYPGASVVACARRSHVRVVVESRTVSKNGEVGNGEIGNDNVFR